MDALHTNGCQSCARSEALYHREYEVTRKCQNQVEQLTDFLGGNPMIGHLRQLNICREVSSLANRRSAVGGVQRMVLRSKTDAMRSRAD